jgi:SAM-dependent methyltransferase
MTEQHLEEVACNLCGSRETTLWARVEDWRVVRCLACGLIYTNPRPAPGQLTASYEEDYQESHQDPVLLAQRRRMYELERRDLLRRVSGGRFLDVGCGPGEFLALLADRFEVWGVDVSRGYVRHAREVLGLERVQVGELSGAGLPENYFDVAQLRGVIQHLPDPLAQAREAWRVLRPGGLLVVSATPNIGSLCARIFREGYRLLAPQYMVYNFTPQTLQALLQQAGFTIEALTYPYWGTPYFRWWQGLQVMGRGVQRGWSLLRGKPQKVLSPPFYGNMMTCYARKPVA